MPYNYRYEPLNESPCGCLVQILLAIFPVPENGFVSTIIFEREKNYLFVWCNEV